MLALADAYKAVPAGGGRSLRIRVLGDTGDGRLLYLVNQEAGSAIELVSNTGFSVTVIFFKSFIDFVSADLSPDKELLHATRRVPSEKGFSFISNVYAIHTGSVSKDLVSSSPIEGYFVEGVEDGYQLLHIVGAKMTHLRVQCSKRGIAMEKVRGGVHLATLLWWKFDRKNATMVAVHVNERVPHLSEFQFGKKNVCGKAITVNEKAKLPKEVALMPDQPMHLPMFRGCEYRMFVKQFRGTLCVIQQLFGGEESPLMFAVMAYPKMFNRIICVPGVQCDLPISFLEYDSIVAVFVPNEFMFLVDVGQVPPNISQLSKEFVMMPCGKLCESLPITNYVIDLDSSMVHKVSFTFKQFNLLKPIMTRMSWDAFAQIAARLMKMDHITSMLHLLELMPHYEGADMFIHDFFNYCSMFQSKKSYAVMRVSSAHASTGSLRSDMGLKHERRILSPEVKELLREMEKDLPMANGVPRKYEFKRICATLLSSRQVRSLEHAAQKAFDIMKRQNEIVLSMRDYLDSWIDQYHPEEFTRLVFYLILATETAIMRFPAIPVVRDDVESILCASYPLTVCKSFAAERFVGTYAKGKDEEDEVNYWMNRLPLEDSMSARDESTSSWMPSRGFTMTRTRSERSDISETSESASIASWVETPMRFA